MAFGLGSAIWKFDSNYRVYKKGQSGPVWREHWRKEIVTGETARSWIIGNGNPRYGGFKLPKSDVVNGTYDKQMVALNEDDIDRASWVVENRYRISSEITRIDDYYILQQVAKAINYKECAQ